MRAKATEFGISDKIIERKKVMNRIVSDSSESEDEGLMVKATEFQNPTQAASETPIAPLLKPSVTGKIKTQIH